MFLIMLLLIKKNYYCIVNILSFFFLLIYELGSFAQSEVGWQPSFRLQDLSEDGLLDIPTGL